MRREKLTQIVTFRLNYKHWTLLELAAQQAGERPNDWARDLTIATLDNGFGLKPNERVLFEQFVGTHYLIANGLQLLADGKFSGEEWKKLRLVVKEKGEMIAERALQDRHSKRSPHSVRRVAQNKTIESLELAHTEEKVGGHAKS